MTGNTIEERLRALVQGPEPEKAMPGALPHPWEEGYLFDRKEESSYPEIVAKTLAIYEKLGIETSSHRIPYDYHSCADGIALRAKNLKLKDFNEDGVPLLRVGKDTYPMDASREIKTIVYHNHDSKTLYVLNLSGDKELLIAFDSIDGNMVRGINFSALNKKGIKLGAAKRLEDPSGELVMGRFDPASPLVRIEEGVFKKLGIENITLVIDNSLLREKAPLFANSGGNTHGLRIEHPEQLKAFENYKAPGVKILFEDFTMKIDSVIPIGKPNKSAYKDDKDRGMAL